MSFSMREDHIMKQMATGIMAVLMAVSLQANAEDRRSNGNGDVLGSPQESTPVNGQRKQVEMYKVSKSGGEGEFIGTIRVVNRVRGTLYVPALVGLDHGLHGFHIHENADCSSATREPETGIGPEHVAAGSAGEHWDPGLTGNHSGPYGDGHAGDLPNLYANKDGVAEHPIYAPRVKLMDLSNRALVIHANPDNYTDEPKNGGSGARVACGVVR